MQIVDRKDVIGEYNILILNTETHHNHTVILDEGMFRWKKDEAVDNLVDKMGFNELIELFHRLGHGRNSEIVRKLYRDMGVSLYLYWEVFYWNMNNEDAEEYIEQRKNENRKLKLKRLIKKG